MGGRRSSYPDFGHNIPYTLMWFPLLYSAWLLQDAFAARPSSDRNQGYYVAVLQEGAFTHTAGQTEAHVVEPAERRDENPVEHPVVNQLPVEDPEVTRGVKAIEGLEMPGMPKGIGITTLAQLIEAFHEGFPESLTEEQKAEHVLGPFPSDLEALGLVAAIGEAYTGRNKALGDEGSGGIPALLKKLDATDLTKMKEDLERLIKLEQKEKARKAKAAEIEATKQEMETLNLALANSRDGFIKQATEIVASRNTAIKGHDHEFAKNEKYHLRELLASVEEIQTKLQAIDAARHTKKFANMYDQIATLPLEYAKRSGIQGKVPDPMKYQAGDNHDKIYAPKNDEMAPFMRAGEPKRPPKEE